MSKHIALLMTLALSAPALADPVQFICERPAWDGKEGCGPNNTYYTYNLLVETRDFDDRNPMYTFQKAKGCDASRGHKYRYHYAVNDDTVLFQFKHIRHSNKAVLPTIRLDRNSMKAVMSGVEKSPELTCRIAES